MKMRNIAIFSAAVCAFVSCSAGDMMPSADADYIAEPRITIAGTITDEEGNAINHIKVRVTCEATNDVNTVYTTLKGRFYSSVGISEHPVIINIQMEDIDGEENGGLFETLTDTITIMEGDDVDATYRLTRATL